MTLIKILHNAKAGDENHSREKLIALVEKQGFECVYSSVKDDNWDDFSMNPDIIAVAGGDGTVRKVAKKMLSMKKKGKKTPVGILPMGTANNLYKSLLDKMDDADVVQRWKSGSEQAMDIGKIRNLKKHDFFIEALGLGLFPALIKRMKENGQDDDFEPEMMLKVALQQMLKLCNTFEPEYSQIIIDGKDYSGDYIMVEIMNIPSIGPNLLLAGNVDLNDGELDVVLLKQSDRADFENYISRKLLDDVSAFGFKSIKGKNIQIKTSARDFHIDDKLLSDDEIPELDISVGKSALCFMN